MSENLHACMHELGVFLQPTLWPNSFMISVHESVFLSISAFTLSVYDSHTKIKR